MTDHLRLLTSAMRYLDSARLHVGHHATRSLCVLGTAAGMFTFHTVAMAQPAPVTKPAPVDSSAPNPPAAPVVAAPVAPGTAESKGEGSVTAAPPANASQASEAEVAPSTSPHPAAATAAPLPPAAPRAVSEPNVLGSSPEPQRPEAALNALFDVALVLQNVWNSDPAYDYFASDNQLIMGGVSVGFDALDLTPGTVFSLDLTAVTGETEHAGPLPVFISKSSLRRTDLGLGIAVRHHLWYWLAPHVRFSGAAAFETATVASPDFEALEVEQTNLVGSIGGGFTLQSAAKRISATRSYFNSLAFRLTAEGGYQFAGSIPFEVGATAPSEGIARAAIPLGELDQRGPYLRMAVGAHF